MGKPSRRLVSVLASAVLLATVGASSAAASPPDGACPPSFVEATYEEMFETFPEVPERFGPRWIRDQSRPFLLGKRLALRLLGAPDRDS